MGKLQKEPLFCKVAVCEKWVHLVHLNVLISICRRGSKEGEGRTPFFLILSFCTKYTSVRLKISCKALRDFDSCDWALTSIYAPPLSKILDPPLIWIIFNYMFTLKKHFLSLFTILTIQNTRFALTGCLMVWKKKLIWF